MNKLALSVPWRPGGGALVFAANGEWIVESFEQYQTASPVPLANLGYNQYRAGGELQWRFLPRTSGVLQASYYTRVANESNQPQNANGVDVYTGLVGLLTPRVAATAKVGYGSSTAQASSFTNPSTNQPVSFPSTTYGTALADLAVEWLPVDAFSIRVGYNRSLGLDPVLSIMVQDSVSGVAQVKFQERYAFHVGARWDSFGFKMQGVDGSTSFLRIDPTVEAKFGQWLTGGLGYVYSSRSASWPAGGIVPQQPSYSKNEAFLKVGVTY